MYIEKLKVRPRKAAPFNPCVTELSAMLGCWATYGDICNNGTCAEAAQLLFECMRTTPMKRKLHKPTINYHLARLKKQLK